MLWPLSFSKSFNLSESNSMSAITSILKFPILPISLKSFRFVCLVVLPLFVAALLSTNVLAGVGAVTYSGLSGGAGSDVANAVAIDGEGNIYVTGQVQTDVSGDPKYDVFVARIDRATGTETFYTTLGTDGVNAIFDVYEQGNAIAVDANGLVYIAGTVVSGGVGDLAGCNFGTFDAFVAVLNPDSPPESSVSFLECFGRSLGDSGEGIAVDAQGNIYLTGTSVDSTPDGFLDNDAYLVRFKNTTLPALGVDYSLETPVFLSGVSMDQGRAVAIGPDAAIYVVGSTSSPDYFPPTVIQEQWDAFLARFDFSVDPPLAVYKKRLDGVTGDMFVDADMRIGNACGGSVVDEACALAVSADNSVFIGGSWGGGGGFVTKLNGGSEERLWTAANIGNDTDSVRGVALDTSGQLYAAGGVASETLGAAVNGAPGEGDAFLMHLNTENASILSSVYLGGSGSDRAHGIAAGANNLVYLTGFTASTDYPQYPSGGSGLSGASDAFMMRVDMAYDPVVASNAEEPFLIFNEGAVSSQESSPELSGGGGGAGMAFLFSALFFLVFRYFMRSPAVFVLKTRC